MTYFEAMSAGLANVYSWPNILIPVAGTALAMVSSFLPGIGGSSVAALLILLTVTWDPISVLLLFGAVTGGATFMGSVTAILFNIPGNSSAAAAMLDGYPMTRKGLPRTAIACAATASALGSIVGVCVLIAMLPIVRPFLLEFGPLERLLLGIWGLSTIVAIPNSSALKAATVTVLGLVAASIGNDPTTALPRWNFGGFALYDGFDMIALLLGFFTITELLGWRKDFKLSQPPDVNGPKDSVLTGILAVFRHYRLLLRSSVIGTVVGIIPGVGGTVAGFVSYGQAVQSAKDDRSQFGKGDIRGLIAPEAAVDAKDGGSLLPALAFGLPGSEAGVILVTVLAIHGLVPGTPMLTVDLSLTFTLIMALLLSNILTSVVGVLIAPSLARLTHMRVDRIALPVLVASFVTIMQLNGSLVDLYVVVGFGLFGYLLKHFDWPRVPFVIAFILGSFIERNVALTGRLVELDRLSIFDRPAAMIIVIMIIASFLWMARKKGQTKERHTLKPYAATFALTIAGVAAILVTFAFSGLPGYSLYAQSLSMAAMLLCLFIAVRDWKGRVVMPAGLGPFGLPKDHMIPLYALIVLPITTFLFSLPIGVAAMVLVWTMGGGGNTNKAASIRIAMAGLVAIATYFYLDRVANVIIPEGLITQLLT
jgi:TctA family transporter